MFRSSSQGKEPKFNKNNSNPAFGMYFANSHKELQETIRASVQEWNKEFEEDEQKDT